MSVIRPPRLTVVFHQMVILLLSAAAFLPAQDLILPDLILFRQIRTDIPQPDNFPDAAVLWNAELPSYRRQYPLLPVHIDGPEMIVPGKSLSGIPLLEDHIPEDRFFSPIETGKLFPFRAAGVEADILEGIDAYYKNSLGGFGTLGGRFFIPFSENSPRPVSAEINWERMGIFFTDTRVGLQADAETAPYLSSRLGLEPGAERPDSYYLNLHEFGAEDPGFSGIGGAGLELPFGDSNWSVISGIDGGGWYASSGSGGKFRASIAAGLRLPEQNLTLEAGFDGSYGSTQLFQGSPHLLVNWFPNPGFRLYADAGLISGYPDTVDNTFSYEKVSNFIPEMPVSSRFRIGLDGRGSGVSDYRLELSYGYGIFVKGSSNTVRSSYDERIGGSASFGHNFNSGRIAISGNLDYSVRGNPDIWDARLEYTWQVLALYLSGGSEDAILGSELPGIRGEQPIMGIGLDWSIKEQWYLGTLLYAAIPWDRPSIKLSIDWSN